MIMLTRQRAFAVAVISAGLVLAGSGAWIKVKAVAAQVLLERAFAETVNHGKPVKAWGWADAHPVARITSDRLKQSSIVLSGGSGEAMAFGPGHLAGTPSPGEAGTSVIAAHRDTHFSFLKHLRRGDLLSVDRSDGDTISFQVTGTRIVRWDAPDIDLAAPGRNLVLATCWPFDSDVRGPLRYVVEAVMTDSGDVKQQ